MKGALAAKDGILCITVRKQIFCSKDIRAFTILFLPIGSEQCEEIIIVGISLCTCKKIVKELSGVFVVLVKYGEVAAHDTPPRD